MSLNDLYFYFVTRFTIWVSDKVLQLTNVFPTSFIFMYFIILVIQHNIVQLHGCVPFYIWHLTWTSTILLSRKETNTGTNDEY